MKERGHVFDEYVNHLAQKLRIVFRNVPLVGKVEFCFKLCRHCEQLRLPCGHALPKPSFGHRKGRLPLALGFGRQQIGQSFGFGKIDPAILERATGEFAGLGGARPLYLADRGQHSGDHRPPAMEVKFDQIFACCRLGPREPENQGLIEPRPVCTAKRTIAGAARCWAFACEPVEYRARARPTNADNRNSCRGQAARQGKDRVIAAQDQSFFFLPPPSLPPENWPIRSRTKSTP